MACGNLNRAVGLVERTKDGRPLGRLHIGTQVQRSIDLPRRCIVDEQIMLLDTHARSQRNRTFDDVVQFADVARIVQLQKTLLRRRGDPA